MSNSWYPIHDNHAIDVMAAVVAFAEPIPELIFKKILKTSEDVAFANGLRSRHLFQQGMALTIGAGGVQSVTPDTSVTQGRTFNSLIELSEDQPLPTRIAEQLQVAQTALIYRTWRYVSWNWQMERIRALMTPALSVAVGLVFVGSQRLEYLDRFRFEGDISNARTEDVLRRESDRLAPQIFSRSDLWHSHSGAYLPSNDSIKRLEQTHVDAIDEPLIGPPNTRWINVMTAREDRYLDTAIDQTVEGIFASFDSMHADLIQQLASIVTADVANRIYLTGEKQ
jgi:hypothetical protein